MLDTFIEHITTLRSEALKASLEGKEPDSIIAWMLSPEWTTPTMRTTASMAKAKGRGSWSDSSSAVQHDDGVVSGACP